MKLKASDILDTNPKFFLCCVRFIEFRSLFLDLFFGIGKVPNYEPVWTREGRHFE